MSHWTVRVTFDPELYPVRGERPPSVVSYQRWNASKALTFDFADPLPVTACILEEDLEALQSRPWFMVTVLREPAWRRRREPLRQQRKAKGEARKGCRP